MKIFSKKKKRKILILDLVFKTLARHDTPGFPGPKGIAGTLRSTAMGGPRSAGQFAISPTCQTSLPLSLATLPPATYLSCSQGHKIVHCFWNSLSKETDDHPAYIFISNSQVKVHLRKKAIKT